MTSVTFVESDVRAAIRVLSNLFGVPVRDDAAAHAKTQELIQTLIEKVQIMSQTQTQEAADVAQLGADIKTLTDGIAALKAQVATVQQMAAAAAGSVPADLQAQIDALHQLAQTIAPAVTPASTPVPAPSPAPAP